MKFKAYTPRGSSSPAAFYAPNCKVGAYIGPDLKIKFKESCFKGDKIFWKAKIIALLSRHQISLSEHTVLSLGKALEEKDLLSEPRSFP